jgi:peptidoglycan hydrolase-like protein with peptidoglycan-binding domain
MANWPVQQVGSTGENVRSVQYLLNAHGATISVDGDFGPITKSAVQQFQSANGLQADGIVGNMTWPVLIVQVQLGSTGPAVEAVQSQIDSRVDILAMDGDFGPQTDGAVRNFQAPVGLQVDGIVGPNTWNAFVNGYLLATSGNNAAQLVFQAWSQANQASAAKNATPQAVAQLFAQTWAPNTWTFAGCGAGAGSVYCTWNKSGGGQLVLRANNNTGAPFYYVTSATF